MYILNADAVLESGIEVKPWMPKADYILSGGRSYVHIPKTIIRIFP